MALLTLIAAKPADWPTPNNPAWNSLAFGDSITVGTGASDPSTTAYVPLLGVSENWAVSNFGHSGDQAADMADEVYFCSAPGACVNSIPRLITTSTISTVMIGANDERIYYIDPGKLEIYRHALLAELAWLAIPTAQKVYGQSSSVTVTGTWTNTVAYGGSLGITSHTNGSTATASVFGRTVYVSTIVQDSTNATFTLSVDGTSYGPYNSFGTSSVATYNGRTYSPWLIRIPGLPNTMHSVIMTVTSPTGVTNVYLDWMAGSGWNPQAIGPYVFVANVTRQTAAGYNAHGGSDLSVSEYCDAVSSQVQQLASDGLNVVLADANSYVNPATDISSDGIHPNDSGHGHIRDALVSATNAVTCPRNHQWGCISR